MREEVYTILPFIMTMAYETFEAQKTDTLKSLPGSQDYSNFTQEVVLSQKQSNQKRA